MKPSPPGPLSRPHTRTPGRGGGGNVQQCSHPSPLGFPSGGDDMYGDDGGSCALPSPGGPGVRPGEGPGVRAFLLSALLLLPATGLAQDRLSLPGAVDRALTRFPAVEAARARQEEAAEALGEARAARRPRGRVTGSAIQYQEPMVVTPI